MKHSWKHILSLLLAAAMLYALVCPALAVGEDGEEGSGPSVTWEKIDASPRGIGAPAFELADEDPYGPDDVVRVSIVMEQLPYEHLRWIVHPERIDIEHLSGTSDMKRVKDLKGNPLLLFANSWSVGMVEDRNPGLVLEEFGRT